ncbi:hypothetical protein KSP40_PGU007199 [Platanthera guangdongensis]|uniref:Uncharacterized protein n=1 Tax=Platanthera guangdongensis TaxID=2320717 RepID=A0ABR2LF26_9ASPA
MTSMEKTGSTNKASDLVRFLKLFGSFTLLEANFGGSAGYTTLKCFCPYFFVEEPARNENKRELNKCIPFIYSEYELSVTRYKGFLRLIKRCSETTMDDDTDSDRSKGKKLDTGFSVTTKMWDYAYGLRYWRVGAMNKGVVPALL